MHEIEDIMSTNVVSVTSDTPIARVIELLAENNITGIPVVDADNHLIGIITEKNVMETLAGPEIASAKACDYMTEEVVSFNINDNLVAVCESLINNHFRRIPILREGKLVGIISRRDLIKYIIEPITA